MMSMANPKGRPSLVENSGRNETNPDQPTCRSLERRFIGTALDRSNSDNPGHAVSARRCFWKICGASTGGRRICTARYPDHIERQHWRPAAGLYDPVRDSAHFSAGRSVAHGVSGWCGCDSHACRQHDV